MKNVVLIGASGFVGTAILNELLSRTGPKKNLPLYATWPK